MKWKKVMAVVLSCAMLITAFAGCSGGGGSSGGGSSSSVASGSEESSASTPEETPEVDNTFVQNEDGSFVSGGISFPLEEEVTYTFFTTPDASTMDLTGGDLYNNTFWQEFTKRTNVRFEFITPAIGTERERYNITISSGDLPDVMSDPVNYSDGLDAAVDDGYFMDLTELIPVYMPDYLKVLQDSGYEKDVITDQERYVALAMIFTHIQAPTCGLVIRQDWLEELNMEVPQTYEELEAALEAFKTNYNCEAPLALSKQLYRRLGAGYGVYVGAAGNQLYQVDGKVKDNYLENPEGAKAFYTTMNRWYENGLMDANFMATVSRFPDVSMLNSEQSGASIAMYSAIDTTLKPVQDAGGQLVGVPTLKENADDELMFNPWGSTPSTVTQNVTISASCENVETLLAAFNYFFTEPGFMLANYGIEGQEYTLDEEGNPVFSEEMSANIAEGLRLHTLPPSWGPSWVEPDRQNASVSANALEMQQIWDGGIESAYAMPSVTLTAEEMDEFSSIYNDLNTFAEEHELQFITGALDIETEWDSFIQQYTDMGAERCVEIYQAALDRYNAR